MLKSTFSKLLEKVRTIDRKTNEYVLQQFWNIYSQSSISTTISSIDRKTNEHVLQPPWSIYSQSSIPTLITSKEGKFIEYNEAMFELTGYTHEEVPDIDAWMPRIYPDEEYRGKVIEISRKSRQREFDVKRDEFILTRKDGEKRYVEFSFYNIMHEGKPADLHVIQGVDITKRKKAEESLRESEEKYHSLFEYMFNGFAYCKIIVDENNRPVDWIYQDINPAFEKIIGLTKKMVIGKKVTEVIPGIKEDTPELLEIYGKVALTGEEARFEIYLDTLQIWFSIMVISPQKGFFVAVFKDITERKKAEEALKKKTSELNTILTNMDQGIAYLDENNIIIYLNHQCAELFGLKHEDVFGKNIYDFHHPQSRKKIESLINEFRNGGKTLNLVESINDKFIDITFRRIEDTDGNYQGILMNAVDITERKKLETQFVQAQKMESVGQLAGGVAHDFNNILTVILGNAELALMSLTQEEPIIENIMEIKNSADRAANLTRQLLAFSRRQIIEPQVFILNNIILEMEKMFHCLIGENIELVTIPAENLWPVKIDPGQIEQVLINLVVNARDAMPMGGKLTFETANVTFDEEYTRIHAGTKPGDFVMMAVNDTGVGMDEDTMLHIFDPFFTTKEHGKGTGLGLSTCYGIIKQNNGNIWVYSEPGHGTSIKIYLPREFGEITNSIKRRNNSSKGTETIFVVEDEPKVRQVTSSILRGKGYTIYEAANGEEALRVAEEDISWNIHLLITDVVMPRMSGKELSEHFKIKNPDIKVLFVSGYTDNSIVHHGILEPGIPFLQKPFSPAALGWKVRQVLDE